MRSAQDHAIKYGFSGHETFPFRYTWLPKGVGHLLEDSDLFTKDDALVTLGVGKNMVRSIRHWCTASGVIERVDHRGRVRVTDLGLSLFGEEGWDPFIEDPGTLWLLHWRFVSRPGPASTWHLAFTRRNTDQFDREELLDWLLGFAREVSGTHPTPASLRRDVDVFIRTYAPAQAKRERPVEEGISPSRGGCWLWPVKNSSGPRDSKFAREVSEKASSRPLANSEKNKGRSPDKELRWVVSYQLSPNPRSRRRHGVSSYCSEPPQQVVPGWCR